MRRVFRPCGVALVALGLAASPALADPITAGSLSPITLQGGGTIGGFLTFDSTGTAVSDWNIVETGGAFGGFNFTDFTFTTANSHVTFNPTFLYGGFTLSTLDIRTNDYPGTAGSHDLFLAFDQIPATIPAGGAALTICTDLGRVCGDPASGINIPSGEFVTNPTASDPFGYAARDVTGGFFTISDPPGSISLNFTVDPVLIPSDGNGGGGGTQVPEPATLTLFGFGAAFLGGSARNRRRRMAQ